MLEPEPLKRVPSPHRRNPRPLSLIPDLDVPPLVPRWFHAINNPLTDPITLRKAKSSSSLNNSSTKLPKSPSTPKVKNTAKWVPFSERDSAALEKAYQNNDVRAKVSVNEDHLFEVDVQDRIISPVYWEGPTYEVRRATWFMQGDGSKWIPCEENLAEQIELGYYKHKPYAEDEPQQPQPQPQTTKQSPSIGGGTGKDEPLVEEKKLEMKLSKQSVDKQWNLLGRYLGQYIVYTGKNNAWLLSNSASGKFAKSIITRLTNKQNLGGTRLLRGYPAVEEQTKKTKSTSTKTPATVEEKSGNDAGNMSSDDESSVKNEEQQQMEQNEEDYSNEESEGEVRKIDHLVFVVHGIGQKMSEKTGHTFIHDVNVLRKTMKLAYPTVMASTTTPQRANGIQVLPIMWRQDVRFGMAADDEGEAVEADLGTVGVEDGCPTLDELTLEGVPNIRTVVSDVLMDVPLYMTQRYRELMTCIIAKEINRVYTLFQNRNPDFVNKGKVSILGYSLGSLLAFDVLTLQPPVPFKRQPVLDEQPIPSSSDRKLPPLLFPCQNFFAVGSPLGVILLLRGFKIASRKSLKNQQHQALSDIKAPSPSSINFCYPAVENLYNIFHKSDPVAYRMEPLIARHYTAKLKPEPIPYMKGGLKGVIDASFNVGSGIANRAGAMYESLKMGLTTNLFMRGLGLSRQQIYEDTHPQNGSDSSEDEKQENKKEEGSGSGGSGTGENDLEGRMDRLTRIRSNSDPARAFSSISGSSDFIRASGAGSIAGKSSIRKAPPLPLPTSNATPYSEGARKLKMLNVTGRVDYCLQEGLLENPYLSAFSAHMQYWQDVDVAAFLVKQLYTTPE